MSTSPWNSLAKRRPSAAEVKDTQERMNLVGAVTELQDRVGEVEQASQDVADHLGYAGDEYLVPVNDNIPPAAPAGLVVTPMPYRELDATWDTPPGGDYVVASVMEVTPSGGSATEYPGRSLDAFATSLAGGVVHSVRVKLVDNWGLESAWSAPVTATPMLTVSEQIDLDALAILGRLQGLLPNANLTTITDATKLGSGVVLAQAMAVQDAVAINLWVQNAAIQSAKIASLAVDKLITGTITAASITLAGSGQLVGGQTTFGASGIAVAPTANLDDTASGASYRISNAGATLYSHLHFYTEPAAAQPHRGLVMRSDGATSGTTQGIVEFHAVPSLNGTPYNRFAGVLSIHSRSATDTQGQVVLWPKLLVTKGDVSGDGGIYADGTIHAAGLEANLVDNQAIATDQVNGRTVATGAIGTVEIVTGGVTSNEVGDRSLNGIDIASGGIGQTEIVTDGVGSAEIAADSVGGSELITGSVGTVEIATGGVTTNEIADLTILGGDIVTDAIGTRELNGSDAFLNTSGHTHSSTVFIRYPRETRFEWLALRKALKERAQPAYEFSERNFNKLVDLVELLSKNLEVALQLHMDYKTLDADTREEMFDADPEWLAYYDEEYFVGRWEGYEPMRLLSHEEREHRMKKDIESGEELAHCHFKRLPW